MVAIHPGVTMVMDASGMATANGLPVRRLRASVPRAESTLRGAWTACPSLPRRLLLPLLFSPRLISFVISVQVFFSRETVRWPSTAAPRQRQSSMLYIRRGSSTGALRAQGWNYFPAMCAEPGRSRRRHRAGRRADADLVDWTRASEAMPFGMLSHRPMLACSCRNRTTREYGKPLTPWRWTT